MKKDKIIIFCLIALAVAGLLFWAFIYNTPKYKVERQEKAVEKLKETSGYNACIEKVDENIKKQKECIENKIKIAGYNDGLDCIDQYDNPICKDTTRYNIEVNATNECGADNSIKVTNLSKLDCYKMLDGNK